MKSKICDAVTNGCDRMLAIGGGQITRDSTGACRRARKGQHPMRASAVGLSFGWPPLDALPGAASRGRASISSATSRAKGRPFGDDERAGVS